MKNKTYYLVTAIQKLKPGAEFSITEDDYSTIKWDVLDGNAPTQAEIDAAIQQIQADEIQAATQIQADKTALLAKLGITADEAKLLFS
jgi:hypothetical protein